MLTKEQLEFRKTGIGGSEITALWGMNKYTQPIDVFYSKRADLAEAHGYVPREVSGFAVDRGNFFEDPTAALYTHLTGIKVRKSNIMHRHPKYPWLIANIDRKIEGERAVLEIKTVSPYSIGDWGPDGTDEVAEFYIGQPHAYMLVLDYERAELAALFGLDELRRYHFERDKEMDELIIQTTHDFWHNHVLKGIPPEIDANHPAASEAIKRTYPGTDGTEIMLPDSVVHWHAVLEESSRLAKQYSDSADIARNHIMAAMGNAAIGRAVGIDGAYVRRKVVRKAYEVAPSEYMNFSFSKKA